MGKHTPGPWPLETVKTSVGICHKIGMFPTAHISGEPNYACVYVDSGANPATADELLANATLMAAAPDMLSALQNIENDVGPDSMWEMVQAAISKATQAPEPSPDAKV